jgi:hypothetical protein
VGTPAAATTVTLGEGESASCAITNDDDAPELTLIKNAINDNGRGAQASEWTLTATPPTPGTPVSGQGTQDATLNQATLGPTTVTANVAYALSESGGPITYEPLGWQCTVTDADGVAGTPAAATTVTLGEGESAECVITNDDIAKAQGTIATSPDPSTGIVGVTLLNDVAGLSGFTADPAASGAITFKLFPPTDPTCSGTPAYTEAVNILGNGTYPTQGGFTPNATGTWQWTVEYPGDDFNEPASSDCGDEPVEIIGPVAGKTMGFWGNNNGNALLEPFFTGGGSVLLGSLDVGKRGYTVDDPTGSNKILPNRHDACGPGNPEVFAPCNETTLTPGLNVGTLNTLAGQTLALSYNVLNVGGATSAAFGLQTLDLRGCTAFATGGLTGSSTINEALVAANTLIANSAFGASPATTQNAAGQMNALLGCLNEETIP